MKILVRNWIRFLGIAYLNVTHKVTSFGSSVHCSDPRRNICAPKDRVTDPVNLILDDFDHSVKLGIPAGNAGKLQLSLTIQYQGTEKPPRWSEIPHGIVNTTLTLPFRCTPEGDFTFDMKSGKHSASFADRALSV